MHIWLPWWRGCGRKRCGRACTESASCFGPKSRVWLYGPSGKVYVPIDVSGVCLFLGAVNYHGKFVPGMKSLRYPLDELLKADVKFRWTSRRTEIETILRPLSVHPLSLNFTSTPFQRFSTETRFMSRSVILNLAVFSTFHCNLLPISYRHKTWCTFAGFLTMCEQAHVSFRSSVLRFKIFPSCTLTGPITSWILNGRRPSILLLVAIKLLILTRGKLGTQFI